MPSTSPSAPPAASEARPAEAGPAAALRSIRIPKPSPAQEKGKRWAVVVGLQYTKEERAEWKDRGYIPPLKNAEKDAADFAQILKEKYGYPEDSIILLKGKEATRDAIANLLLEGLFCDDQKVGPDDSVLFYFSGHGVGPEEGASAEVHAYLLPCDAKVNEQGRPNTTFAIDIEAIAAKLRKETECKARHVLLILDCCHSGAVFKMQGAAGGAYEHNGVDDSLLRTRSVQAITSSRATQKASDGNEGNSPFTGSLLRALREVPPSLPRERFSFTTNQLYFAMRAYLNSPTSVEQSPQCRWLDGINAGEFAFYPDPNARFDEISDESRRLLLTMVPSTFGNWWAEEMPWFMPGLRLEILENRSESKSTLADEVDKTKLREAAVLTLKRLRSTPNLDPARGRRLKHLQIMLDVEGAADRRGQYQEVIDDLKAATAVPRSGGQTTAKDAADPEAVDVHYLAVLQDLTGDHNGAEKTFVRALELYEKESKHFVRMQALEALCRSDYGMLQLAGLNDYDAAYEQFHKARGLFGLGSPVPFRVFCLTKEADACRAKGFTGASDTRMDEALALAKTFDPDKTHPLTAAAYKHYAWAKMEQWQFDQAEQRFKKTQEILSKEANRDRPECQIDQLHAKHGLAMIHRFRGEDDEATKAYGELTLEISEEIRRLERKSEEAVNLAEVRALLYDRLVNSLDAGRIAIYSVVGKTLRRQPSITVAPSRWSVRSPRIVGSPSKPTCYTDRPSPCCCSFRTPPPDPDLTPRATRPCSPSSKSRVNTCSDAQRPWTRPPRSRRSNSSFLGRSPRRCREARGPTLPGRPLRPHLPLQRTANAPANIPPPRRSGWPHCSKTSGIRSGISTETSSSDLCSLTGSCSDRWTKSWMISRGSNWPSGSMNIAVRPSACRAPIRGFSLTSVPTSMQSFKPK